jgi:hypothetical protein
MKRGWGSAILVQRIPLGSAVLAARHQEATAETGLLLAPNARREVLELSNLSYSVTSRIFTRKVGAKEILRRSGKAGRRGIIQYLQA